jgi:hypothetical protein
MSFICQHGRGFKKKAVERLIIQPLFFLQNKKR